jgi:hypothetical protein
LVSCAFVGQFEFGLLSSGDRNSLGSEDSLSAIVLANPLLGGSNPGAIMKSPFLLAITIVYVEIGTVACSDV